jgi:hypothetical protein
LGYKIIVKNKARDEFVYPPYASFNYPGLDELLDVAAIDSTSKKEVPRNFFFSGEAVEQLESIKARSFLKTNADAIRVALTSYSELLAIDAAGDEIFVRDRNGNELAYSPHRPWMRDQIAARPRGVKDDDPQFRQVAGF